MDSREIALWVDSRWCEALESATGKTMDSLMRGQVDALIQTLPQDVQDRINEEIRQEDERQAQERESNRRFSVFRITECGETHVCLQKKGEDMFSTAQRLRRYLRGEDQGRGLCQDSTPLTRDEMERYVAEAISGSSRVVGVYDIDLDKGEFIALDIDYGWRTYQIKDVSTAIYHAMKKESTGWKEKRYKFYMQMDGMDCNPTIRPVYIRGAEPLLVNAIGFKSNIDNEAKRFLKFTISVCFDPDAVFGTHVGTSENNEGLNLYVSYDMERGCVCDTLEVYLVRGDGSELDCQYRLTPEECAALLPKMDAYCKEQMGLSLEEARTQYLSEQTPPQMEPTM